MAISTIRQFGEALTRPHPVRATQMRARLDALADINQDRLFSWLPVLLGVGIGAYFMWPVEPGGRPALAAAAAFLVAAGLLRRRFAAAVLCLAVAAVFAGFGLADWRTARVAAPVIAKETGPVPVTGTLISLARQAEGGVRAVIAPDGIGRLSSAELPARVRLNVRTRADAALPGDRVSVLGILLPPPGPVAPGAFDFGRQAWFDRLGAVGYAVGPLVRERAAETSLSAALTYGIARLRARLTERIHESLPGTRGAIAAALMTGERGGIPDDVLADIRDAGLAHLLAISGLHMALFAGALFWAVRGALALVPGLALRAPIKKWAAAIALVGALGYLMVSGASVATQRAFVMFALMFLAVIADRPAITLRNVALAALIVLAMAPESLVEASFQMSFAAATALVAFYEAARPRLARWNASLAGRGVLARAGVYVGGVALTTLVASAATAPFAAYHFNRVVDFGLVANLAAVPIVGTIVMPAALMAFVLMPVGLEALPLWVAGQGIAAIVWVAAQVASWPGAVTAVPAMPAASLALLVLGGLWLALWRGALRGAGALLVVAGIAVAVLAPRPVLLVEREARVVALRDGAGALSFSTARAGSFSASAWLRRDGDGRSQAEAFPGLFRCDALGCAATHPALGTVAVPRTWRGLMEDCNRADLVVTDGYPPRTCAAPLVVGRAALAARGAHAVFVEADGALRVVAACDVTGPRPWTRCGP